MGKSRTTTGNRVAIYARVSTIGHGQDVGLQLEELRAVAQQRGLVVVSEYVDEGISGVAVKRPALDRLLADAQAGALDLVLVWKLDRLGRSLQHLLATLDHLGQWGVGFASVRDPGIDTSSVHGRLLLQLLAVFASYEREIIRERVVAGVRRAQAAGRPVGRPRVELDVRPAVALLGEGRSLKEVARILEVERNTLRARLREAGAWPVPQPGEKPSPRP
jgi:DNA invertase Pin-like site-specific DNA recombinase